MIKNSGPRSYAQCVPAVAPISERGYISEGQTYQISVRAMKKKQKMLEIDGNEPARIGSERKMHRIPTGMHLVSRAVREFIFW